MTTIEKDEKQHLETQLAEFNVTDASIEELKRQYLSLTIKDIEDNDGYKAVRVARLTMRDYRTGIDKRRKQLTEEARKTVNAINEAAKIVTAKIVPIENYLAEQESAYDAEKARIKKEKEEAQALLLKNRISTLASLSFRSAFDEDSEIIFIADYYHAIVRHEHLKIMPEQNFNDLVSRLETEYALHKAKEAAIAEQKRLAKLEEERLAKEKIEKEEAEIKAQQELLKQQRRELEMERERLADIAHMQAEKEKALHAEQEKSEKVEQEIPFEIAGLSEGITEASDITVTPEQAIKFPDVTITDNVNILDQVIDNAVNNYKNATNSAEQINSRISDYDRGYFDAINIIYNSLKNGMIREELYRSLEKEIHIREKHYYKDVK